MLKELHIRDFKLLRDVNLAFPFGLSVLTGETGAGKTQCLEALNAALGTRLGDDVVSKDSNRAVITAVFDLSHRPDVIKKLREDGWLDEDETDVVLERSIERDGASRGRLNGRRVPIGTLQAVGDSLVDILGQHARADLLSRPPLEILDSFGDTSHQASVENVKALFTLWRDAAQLYITEQAEIERASERRELVEYQHAELENAGLKSGDEDRLTKEAELLENAKERIDQSLQAASILAGENEDAPNARDLLNDVLNLLDRLASYDDTLKADAFRLRESMFFVEETAETLQRYADNIVDDPRRRAEVEEKLAIIHNLKRKHKTDEAGLIALRDKLAIELEKVNTASGHLKELALKRDKARDTYLSEAQALSKSREKLGKKISKEVRTHLADLDLPSATFTVELSSHPDDETRWRTDGIDRAELLIATNPAQEPAPLKKAASGGELSRLLIALKTVLAKRDRVPVLVFDEAEAGIGGETAFKVGEKLVELSRSHQLILVSHLPQIASQACGHWVIEKSIRAKDTRAEARSVSDHNLIEARVQEISRMLGDRGDRKALEKLARSFLKGTRENSTSS